MGNAKPASSNGPKTEAERQGTYQFTPKTHRNFNRWALLRMSFIVLHVNCVNVCKQCAENGARYAASVDECGQLANMGRVISGNAQGSLLQRRRLSALSHQGQSRWPTLTCCSLSFFKLTDLVFFRSLVAWFLFNYYLVLYLCLNYCLDFTTFDTFVFLCIFSILFGNKSLYYNKYTNSINSIVSLLNFFLLIYSLFLRFRRHNLRNSTFHLKRIIERFTWNQVR